MKSLQALVHSQSQHAQSGGDFLGSLVWWSLNGNRVAHARLKELADQHGLPERYLPKEIRPASAFRRAWRHASSRLPAGLLLRQIDESPTGIHVGLVQEQADTQAHELAYNHLVTIAFSKDHHTIQSSTSHPIVDEIRALFAHHLELTTQDIRSMISSFVSEAGVSLRESGGVYFIASPHQKTIEAMASVLGAIGHNHLHQLPLYDSPMTQNVLSDVAVTTIDAEIRRLGEELQTFMADDKTRTSTLEKRLDMFDALRSRVSTFAGVLSFKSDDLLSQVSVMEEDLRRHLGISPVFAEKKAHAPLQDAGHTEESAVSVVPAESVETQAPEVSLDFGQIPTPEDLCAQVLSDTREGSAAEDHAREAQALVFDLEAGF